jgi:hypothetical protein
MRRKVYLETTVVSYLAARPSRDLLVAGHQEATRELWPSLATTFETFVSALGLRGGCSRGCPTSGETFGGDQAVSDVGC